MASTSKDYQNQSSQSTAVNSARRHNELPLEADWYSDPKWQEFFAMQEDAWDGVGPLFLLACLLRREWPNAIQFKQIRSISYNHRWQQAKVERWIKNAITCGIFISTSDGFRSAYVDKRCTEYEGRCAQLRKNAKSKKADAEQLLSNCLATSEQPQSVSQSVSQAIKTVDQGKDDLTPAHPLDGDFLPGPTEIGTGARPLKEAPGVKLTTVQLQETYDLFNAVGLKDKAMQIIALKNAEAHAARQKFKNANDFYCWLRGWATEEALNLLAAGKRLENVSKPKTPAQTAAEDDTARRQAAARKIGEENAKRLQQIFNQAKQVGKGAA